MRITKQDYAIVLAVLPDRVAHTPWIRRLRPPEIIGSITNRVSTLEETHGHALDVANSTAR